MTKIQQQQGVVLVISLVFLALMTIVGVTAMQGTTQEEKMANNAAQRALAFQHAETGLRIAEASLSNVATNPFDNTTPGLRGPVNITTNNIANYWMDNYDWDNSSMRWCNNDSLCDTLSDEIKQQQRYVIERTPIGNDQSVTPDLELLAGRPPLTTTNNTPRFFYRITARSTGNVTDAVVILQSTVM